MEEDEENPPVSSVESVRSPAVLPWDRFSNWLHCACVVTFDLELGQAMEIIYPSHIRMTEKEMGVFKGRTRKGLTLSYRKCRYPTYSHSKSHSVKLSKPLKNSTPCLHKTGGSNPSKHKMKRTLNSTIKARTPFKSPLLKKARTVSPTNRLHVSMLSPISKLKIRTPRKSNQPNNKLLLFCLCKRVGTISLDYRYLDGLGTTRMSFWAGCMGDTQFHFRIRQCPGRKQVIKSHIEYNKDCPVQLKSDDAHYYGFVFFRQTKDRSIRRGYFQKSVVLVSKLPFIALFSQLVSIIAPEYFENGEPSLEAACHDIDQWCPPIPGETLSLPIFGTVLQVRVPSRSDKLVGQVTSRPPTTPSLPAHTVLPSLFEVDIFSSFQSILPHVQMLWELVLTGEPLVVMAASPSITSSTVQSLVSLISPLNYCPDFRPYFTIHDSEFKEYTTKTQAPPAVILGVTNPFFAKTLQHWPHIIRIGEMVGDVSVPKGFNKLKKASSLKTLDCKPGVYTRYKPFLLKDKGILKRLIKGMQSKRPVEAQNAILRRHFLELTQSFMIPLERYVASLMPLQRNISPHKGPPSLRQFDVEEFMRSLDQAGPQLTSGVKGDWEGLYRRFFRSPNFEGWYYHRQYEVNQKLQMLHLEALCQANLVDWIQDKEEVEIVDLILRIREKLKFASNNNVAVKEDSIHKLEKHMRAIISSLPEDLQSVLNS